MRPAGRPGEESPADAGQEAGTRVLLDAFAAGNPDEVLKLGELFGGLGKRSFGMLLFIAILPAFLPVPGIGGIVSGPLVMLIGAQLVAGMSTPWLPGFAARRGPRRQTMGRFRDRISPWLSRLERLVRPRSPALLDRRLANLVSGLLLIALGVLLSLPIPFTNYLFGALLLLFALAFLERDGRLMGVAWISGMAAITVFGLLSGRLATLLALWMERLPQGLP
ncbi:MAG TPA: exopolysaccharide biosynthesis protein [Lysobacter sp.]|nr:exopolysaccharide biosynthesis protein [Lysobacter sp.]